MITVLAHGTFDLLHLGHVRFLQAARSLGDRLVVSITDDPYVHKGPGRPIFTAEERKEMLLSLIYVDAVLIIQEATGVQAIDLVRPDIYAKGMDYDGTMNETFWAEKHAVESFDGRVVCVPSGEKFSSTELLERLRSVTY